MVTSPTSLRSPEDVEAGVARLCAARRRRVAHRVLLALRVHVVRKRRLQGRLAELLRRDTVPWRPAPVTVGRGVNGMTGTNSNSSDSYGRAGDGTGRDGVFPPAFATASTVTAAGTECVNAASAVDTYGHLPDLWDVDTVAADVVALRQAAASNVTTQPIGDVPPVSALARPMTTTEAVGKDGRQEDPEVHDVASEDGRRADDAWLAACAAQAGTGGMPAFCRAVFAHGVPARCVCGCAVDVATRTLSACHLCSLIHVSSVSPFSTVYSLASLPSFALLY